MSRIYVIGLLVCLASGGPAQGQASSGTANHIRLDQGTEQLESQGEEMARVFTNQVQALSRLGEAPKAPDVGSNPWFYVALGLGIIFVLRKLVPMVAGRSSNSGNEEGKNAVGDQAGAAATVPTYSSASYSVETPSWPQGTTEKEASAAETQAAEEFFRCVSQDLASLRKSLCELGRVSAPDEQKRLLKQLLNEVRSLQNKSNISVVRPLWQLTGGVEGLVNQLTGENEVLKPSTLRTVASAIDLLHSLSVRGVRADLVTHPAPRLLAVDDDPVSRFAVSAALKRYLVKPETATEGEAALALAEETAYDLIFLDVQMPKMDGFELCSRIHATAANRTTPIVFVTCQSDFDARAKSSLMGGQDLIGKPFMASELSLKALTLVIRRRLQGEAAPRAARSASATPSLPPPKAGNSKASEPKAMIEPAFAAPVGAPA
jgi:CheY-like chemotaxis protein